MFTKDGRIKLLLCAALFASAQPSVFQAAAKTPKGLREKDARVAISTMKGLGLNKNAVNVKAISSDAAAAEVRAGVKTAFSFKRVGEGKEQRWTVVEVRTGERQWEDLALVLRALGAGATHPFLSDLDALAADLEARQRELQKRKEAEKGKTGESEGEQASGGQSAESAGRKKAGEKSAKRGEKKKGDGKKEAENETDAGLTRGLFTAKSLSAMLSSATMETEVDASFRLVRERGNKWRVVEFKLGDYAWQRPEAILAALDAEKKTQASGELETLRAALEAFRRERGFYVVARDQAVLVDHLSPRYLSSIIRIDPWHRPYRYEGTRDSYILRSDGPDGKEGTPDDVTAGSPK